MEKTTFFHIGLLKCASRFISNKIFAPHPEINLVPSEYNKELWDFLMDRYNRKAASLIKKMEICRKETEKKPKHVTLFSNGLFAPPTPGPIMLKSFRFIKDNFPNPSVIVVIREQISWLISYWKEYIAESGSLGFYTFYNKFNKLTLNCYPPIFNDIPTLEEQPITPGGQYSFLYYDLLIKKLQKLFGEKNVRVLILEQLEAQPEDFIGRLLNFLEVSSFEKIDSSRVGGGIHTWLTLFMRAINTISKGSNKEFPCRPIPNRIRRYIFQRLRKLSANLPPEKKQKYKNKIPSEIISKFEQSNRRLTDIIDIDLKNYGFE